jgi:hypothetical protein
VRGVWDQHALAVDRDGRVLLVSGSASTNASQIAQLRIDSNGNAYAFRIDSDMVPYSSDLPLVSGTEYGLIVRDRSGSVTSVFRRSSLHGRFGIYSLSPIFL